MDSGAPSVFDRFTTSETLGLTTTLLLWVVLLVVLPGQQRRLARQPLVFLVLHGIAHELEVLAPSEGGFHRDISFVALVLLLAAVGRIAAILLLDIGLGQRFAKPLPKIVRDLSQGVIYLGVLLVALHESGVEPGSLLTTSALLTAAGALALQETAGNMLAGLSIQIQRPFDLNDWIQFDADPKHVGRVIEISWRATKVMTLDEVEVMVPNAVLAKALITNFTKPSTVSRRSVYVQVGADVPPHKVQAIILASLPGSLGVLNEPAPSVVTNAFVDGNVDYWVRFFTDKFEKRDSVDGSVRDRIWYALSRAGVPIGLPKQLQFAGPTAATVSGELASAQEKALQSVDFLRTLSADARRGLAQRGRTRLYAADEIIVKQGDGNTELFIVQSGQVTIARARPDGASEAVARLAPGAFFGEMAAMTGEPRTATVRAVEPCSLFVIDHAALQDLIARTPDLANQISHVIAERQAKNDAALLDGAPEEGADRKSIEERSSALLGRIQRFFSS